MAEAHGSDVVPEEKKKMSQAEWELHVHECMNAAMLKAIIADQMRAIKYEEEEGRGQRKKPRTMG
jgi:hypothetical protein